MIFLTKYFNLLLQIILVVIAVIAFCWFDPFDIIKMRKLRMQQTATMVENIRAIGQLYSAEYYGEVIKSSNQKIVDSVVNELDNKKQAIRDMETAIIAELKRIYQSDKKVSPGDLYKQKLTSFLNRVRIEKKEKVLDHAIDALLRTENVRKELPWILTRPRISVIHHLYEQNKFANAPSSFISAVALESVVEDEYGFTRKESKMQDRNQLVLMARGWVKAGIDFSDFSADHLKYLQDKNRILLIRHRPKILSKSINPWFIPKEKIKGFEYLVIGQNYKKYTDERSMLLKVQQLKTECLDDLEQQALQADLLGIAKKNSEETLSKFFSLLLEKQITVQIFGHPLEAYRSEFTGTDKQLDPAEAASIDSLISIFCDTAFYETTQFALALKELDQSGIKQQIQGTDWNIVSQFYAMSRDSVYSAEEKSQVAALEQRTQPNDYFYYMVFRKPEKLDSILSRHTSAAHQHLADFIKSDSTVTKSFEEFRRSQIAKLKNAMENM
ncbi:MAG TPA: DUF4230 domain-containing protein [Chryseosolibacter sp.]|nr:DUF4230 domain-containing protein [Chryseosolibacter sp.]